MGSISRGAAAPDILLRPGAEDVCKALGLCRAQVQARGHQGQVVVALACLPHGRRVHVWQHLLCVLYEQAVELPLLEPARNGSQRCIIGYCCISCIARHGMSITTSIWQCPDKGTLQQYLCISRRYRYLSMSSSFALNSCRAVAVLTPREVRADRASLRGPASLCINCRRQGSRRLLTNLATAGYNGHDESCTCPERSQGPRDCAK